MIKLTDDEVIYCKNIAFKIDEGNSKSNVKDFRQTNKQTSLEINTQGTLGEFAFCKHFNILFDSTIKSRSSGYDCILKEKRIDIKTTTWKKGIYKTLKPIKNIDIFAQIIQHSENEYELNGWIDASDLMQNKNIIDIGNGPCYFVANEKLNKF